MLVDRVYYCLEAGDVILKFYRLSNGRLGDCCVISGEIRIDLEQDDPVHTLIHEVMHFLHPNAKERWVNQRARRAFERLSYEEYVWFLKKLYK